MRSCAPTPPPDSSVSEAAAINQMRFMALTCLSSSIRNPQSALRYDHGVARPQIERLGVAVQHLLVVEAQRLDAVAALGPEHLHVLRVREFLEAARHRERL